MGVVDFYNITQCKKNIDTGIPNLTKSDKSGELHTH